MTLRHLKIFIEVVETKTMSAAAKNLYIAQPSVSQAVHELEEHYHTLLFERYAKKLYITDSGKLLYTYAKQLTAQFEQLEDNMLTKKHLRKFRLGATVSVGGSILSPVVRRFRETFPELAVYAFVGNTQEIEDRLLDMDLDAGIIEGFVKSPDLVTIPLLEDPMVLACSREHPLARRSTLYIDDLQGQEFVIRESGSGTRELLERFLGSHDIRITVAFEVHTPDAIKNALRFNQCLTLISARLIETELKKGEFAAFASQDSQWSRSFRIVYHKVHSKEPNTSPYIPALKDIVSSYDQKSPLEDIQGYFIDKRS
ncbi:MAG: LysR family transcriptional regulator [Lachnospiraceae bacterium]|jgi:DNA-binding transcriptional LysR family regulator|nr:LysR family transcriptional regulator [Lachnospiraceae bacterium]